MISDPREIAVIARPFDYQVALPGSKSIALRQLLICALAEGPTLVRALPVCDDVDAMCRALPRLGVALTALETGVRVDPAGLDLSNDVELDLYMSGVSLRLIIALAGLRTASTLIDGHEQLRNRPNADLLDAMTALGCEVTSREGKLPITVGGPARGSRVGLRASVTSQYLTALLLTAPRMPEGLQIDLIDQLTSAPYIGITVNEMAKRGVGVERTDTSLNVAAQAYQGGEVTVEGDASAATYHAALATLHAGKVTLTNLGSTTRQGDVAFVALCERMGAQVERTDEAMTIQGPDTLRPVEQVDMVDMPDAAPTLFAMAPYLPRPIHIDGLATLRRKECDRIACSAIELRRAGVQVHEGDDFLSISPSSPKPATFETYEDHRRAMAFAVLATRVPGCRILNPGCVSKTYPDFWDDLALAYG